MKRSLLLKFLTGSLCLSTTAIHAEDKPLPMGSPYELPDEEFEREALQELLVSPTFVSQGGQIAKALTGTLVVPSAEGNVKCRISKSMLNFLLNISRNAVPLQGNLVYDGGGQHARLYRDTDTNKIACVNNAIDITSVNLREVLYVDPDSSLDAVVGLLRALPPGKFEIGLPRQPYPNGERDAKNVSLAGRDVITYFYRKGWTWLYTENPYEPLYIGKNLNPEHFKLQDGNVDSYRNFYSWVYNTNIPQPAEMTLTTGMLWRYLGGSSPNEEQASMRRLMQQGFDSRRVSELTRSMIRNPFFAGEIASAMEDARARGVTILGTYGDALDHIHIEDLEVESPSPTPTSDSSTLTLEYDINYEGRDFLSKKLPRPDWKLCADSCENDTRCEAYTFVPVGIQDPSSALCWLKSGVSTPSLLRAGVSGVRKKLPGLSVTVMHNQDLMGSDYRRSLVSNYRDCARSCDRDNQCRSYTFVQPGVQEASGVCYLKNSVPAASANADTISGVKTIRIFRDPIDFHPIIFKP